MRLQVVLWVALLCVRATTAISQDEGSASDEGTRLEERMRMPKASVTAVRLDELAEDPTSFTTVIEARDFAGEDKTVAEMLGESPGVFVRNFGSRGQFSEVSIRGSTGQQVVVLLDGVRLNSARSGTVDLSSIPAELIERIEVSRGGGAVQAGSDAVGGVVNIITIEPTPTPSYALSVGGGSFGTVQGSASTQGSAGPWGWVAGYAGFHTEGGWEFRTPRSVDEQTGIATESRSFERINSEVTNQGALLRGAYQVSDIARLRISDHFFHGRRGRPGLALGDGPLGGQSPSAKERRSRNVADLQVEIDELGLPELAFESRVYHRYEYSDFEDPDASARELSRVTARDQSGGVRLLAEHASEPFGQTNDLAFTVETRLDALKSSNAGSHRRWVVGVTLRDELELLEGALGLAPALRYDYTEGIGSEWIPRLGVVVEPVSWLRFKANIERAYRVPNFDELYLDGGDIIGDPGLSPEDAITGDLGFQLAVATLGPIERLRLDFAAFYSRIDDSIAFVFLNTLQIQAANTGSARLWGVELGLEFALFRWVDVAFSYTHLDTRVKSSGAPLVGRPADEWNLRVAAGPPSGIFKVVTEIQYTSPIPVSQTGALVLSDRLVLGASVVVDLAPLIPGSGSKFAPGTLLLSLVGNNLTDRSVYDARAFPQPGRTLLFEVSSRW